MNPHVVVGGSIASLVATDRLARTGRRVELHLPERGVGGGFMPIEAAGRRLDLGARLIELSYDDEVGEPPSLDRYRAGPHGHRPYLALIDDLVRDLAGDDLVTVRPPEVSVDRRRIRDYVLNGDLSGVAEVVPDGELAAMAEQAAARLEAEGPRGVFDPAREPERWTRTFADVGQAHAGARFHDRFIESLAAKILPGGSSSVVAALHRKIWLPLFHPLTVWQACTGALAYQPDRSMYSVDGAGMGEVVKRLLDRVTSSEAVQIEQSGALLGLDTDREAGAVTLRFEGGSRTATQPVIGVGAEELFTATGVHFEPDRVVATMVWVDVRDEGVADVPSVLFATEPDLGVFRITENLADRRPGHRTFCCEVDHRYDDAGAWPDLVRAALVALGVIAADAPLEQVAAAVAPRLSHPVAGQPGRVRDGSCELRAAADPGRRGRRGERVRSRHVQRAGRAGSGRGRGGGGPLTGVLRSSRRRRRSARRPHGPAGRW